MANENAEHHPDQHLHIKLLIEFFRFSVIARRLDFHSALPVGMIHALRLNEADLFRLLRGAVLRGSDAAGCANLSPERFTSTWPSNRRRAVRTTNAAGSA